MKLPQFSIRTLLILVALVAFYFPFDKAYRKWLARNHGGSYVAAVLHSELHEGDNLDSVAAHFDSIRLLTPSTDNDYLLNLAAICSRKGLSIQEFDEFYRVSVSSGPGAYLQFRNRKLVNLWNTAYIDMIKYPSQPASYSARLQFYLIYMLICAFFYVSVSLMRYWKKHNKKLQRRHLIHRVNR